MSKLRKANRQKVKIRLGLSSVAGAGKTYSALLIGYGLCGNWNKIAIIDTENNSADLYENLGDYNVYPLSAPFSPENYIKAIKECENEGMELIIIDSLSHEWEGEGGILYECDRIGGGFWSAWRILTPRHDRFKMAILSSCCHIITTVRKKQEYIITEEANKDGKIVQKPIKAGMKDITRDGWEYELTTNFELDLKHNAVASKDRTLLFQDKPSFIPTIETGKMIAEWCNEGIDFYQELHQSIEKLDHCNTIADLKLLKEILPDYIISDKQFIIAGNKKFEEINKKTTQQYGTTINSNIDIKPL